MAGLTYTEPLLAFFLLLGFASLIRAWRRPESPKPVLLTAALAGVFLITWTPVDWLLSRPLELPYEQPLSTQTSEVVQAIVIPASSFEPSRSYFPVALPDRSTYTRCRYAAWLYHEWLRVPIVVSGGNHVANRPPYGVSMRGLLEAEGVPGDAILVEKKSRNTWENAVFSAELLRSKGISTIALIVEADSMLRADLCFRKQGLTVVPAPLRHRSVSFTLEDMLPSWRALQRNEVTLHEVLGLAWYKLQGRI